MSGTDPSFSTPVIISSQRMPFERFPLSCVRSAAPTRCRAFSLLELILVLGVISLLVAAGLPALQQARETARKTQCTQNLKQLGAALLRYHDTHKCFPPGQISALQQTDAIGRYADPQEAQQVPPAKPVRPLGGQSWLVLLLPSMGEEALGNRWDFTKNLRGNGDNGGPAVQEIASLYCPARRSSMEATGRFSGTERVAADWTTGGSDYAGCTGSGIAFKDDDPDRRQTYWLTPPQMTFNEVPGGIGLPYSQSPAHLGVFGVNSKTTTAEIVDGTSTTIIAAERRLFSNAAAGGATSLASSSTPNQRRSSDGWAFGGPATLFTTRLAPQPSGPAYGRHFDEAGSDHPFGVNILRADGSTFFVSLNIDLRTWNNLGNINQGSSVDLF